MLLVVKNPLVDAGDIRDMGSIPGLGRFLGGGQGNPRQHSCLENPTDRGAWWATDHRVTKSQPKRNVRTISCYGKTWSNKCHTAEKEIEANVKGCLQEVDFL